MTILECLSCSHKFPSNEVELTNIDISDKYFRINWNCPKCNKEGLTTFINNKNNEKKWVHQCFVQNVANLKNKEMNLQIRMVTRYVKNAGSTKTTMRIGNDSYNNYIYCVSPEYCDVL
jgi:hypothetical protein